MSVNVQWLGHASFKISGEKTIYIDPWKVEQEVHDADIILISHEHYDHYSAADITRLSKEDTVIIGPGDVIGKPVEGLQIQQQGKVIRPGQDITVDSVRIQGVAAYNPSKEFHPKANEWLGFVVKMDGKRIYYAGDTDMTPEMEGLTDIDLALLPVGGTYTMASEEAAGAVSRFKPRRAVPYHWGDIVGGREDADHFAEVAHCEVTILEPGETLKL